MIIKRVHIEKFRALENLNFDLGKKMTAIVGHNGTLKTTVLGILSQPFTISENNPIHGEKTIDGYSFRSQFKEKFKISDKDRPGEHIWTLELYPGIHKTELFEVKSILRDKKSNVIRFWSSEGREKGMGFIQIPVYYLSLKRVSPIGEEKNFKHSYELSSDELNFYIEEYKQIFTDTNSFTYSVETISSQNKRTVSIHNEEHDALSISAGQDNVGKILLSVLSFRRLMKKYPDDYKGGVLLIDEIESTLHPLAQERLIKRLLRYSSDYKLQFIFTTHSPTIIKSAFSDYHNTNDVKLVYLKRVGNKVQNYNDPNIENVICELSGKVNKPKKEIKKINIFCEDVVGRLFLKSLLSDYSKRLKYMTCSIGAEEYIELLKVNLSQITNAIIVLDGDKSNDSKIKTKLSKLGLTKANVIFLPGSFAPEKVYYNFLHSLDEDAPFWDLTLGGYDKIKCFAEFPNLTDKSNIDEYKKWYNNQNHYWGNSNKKLFDYWKIVNPDTTKAFIDDFISAFNYIAEINGIEKI